MFGPSPFEAWAASDPAAAQEASADQRAAAANMFAAYQSFKESGFTEEQAFALVQTMLQQVIRSSIEGSEQ